MMYELHYLHPHDLSPETLSDFRHQQEITRKYVRKNHTWSIVAVREERNWSPEKRVWIPGYLTEQLNRGGSVIGAFSSGRLVGFASVDGILQGNPSRYANLTMLFADDEFSRRGIGRALFREICTVAEKMGAERLFISAIPSLPTVSFYFSMGCTDAAEVVEDFVDSENDRFLEYLLAKMSV